MSTDMICRLCLHVFSDSFEAFDLRKVEMLKTISLDVDLTLTGDPLICDKCSSYLRRSFNFKKTCLHNDDYLRAYIRSERNDDAILREILQKNADENGIKCKREGVCRFCLMHLDSVSFVNVDENVLVRDALRKCLPEIELGIISQTLMCPECMENLLVQFDFVMDCSDKNEKIVKYILANRLFSKEQVDLNDVLSFTDKLNSDHTTVATESNLQGGTSQIIVKSEEPGQSGFSEVFIKTVMDPTLNLDDHDRRERLKHMKLHHIDCTVKGCDFCLKFKVHSEKRFKDFQRRSWKCPYCSEEFKDSHTYKNHMKTHNDENLVCKYCNKTYLKRAYLRIHMRTHTGETPYECGVCRKKFKRKESLTYHLSTHNKKRELCRCDVCDQEFTHSSNLFRHKRTAHSIAINRSTITCQQCEQTLKEAAYRGHMKQHGVFVSKCRKCREYIEGEEESERHRKLCVIDDREEKELKGLGKGVGDTNKDGSIE